VATALAAKEIGVKSSAFMVEPNVAKNSMTASLPCRTPYQGAASEAASAAQSMSSVRAAGMAATPPRPNAS
jgi:hypothetical protein